jgi:four helix bundle protein
VIADWRLPIDDWSRQIHTFGKLPMKPAELRDRTKRFALRIMALVEALPRSIRGRVVADQVMRSGTSVGANYRAVCRARSRKEFISKLGVVIEEGDEAPSGWR